MAKDLSHLDHLAASNPNRNVVNIRDDNQRQRAIAARRDRERQRELAGATVSMRELARRSHRPFAEVLVLLQGKGAPSFERIDGQRRYRRDETLAWLDGQPRRGPAGPALAVLERSKDVLAALETRRAKLRRSLATARTSAATARVEGDAQALQEARAKAMELETSLAELSREMEEWSEGATNVDRTALAEAQFAQQEDANALAEAAMAAGARQVKAIAALEAAVKALGAALADYHAHASDAADIATALVELAMPGKSEAEDNRRLKAIDDIRELAGRCLVPVGLHRMLFDVGVRPPDGPLSGDEGMSVLEHARDRLARFERRLNAQADKVDEAAEERLPGKLVRVPDAKDVDAIAQGLV